MTTPITTSSTATRLPASGVGSPALVPGLGFGESLGAARLLGLADAPHSEHNAGAIEGERLDEAGTASAADTSEVDDAEQTDQPEAEREATGSASEQHGRGTATGSESKTSPDESAARPSAPVHAPREVRLERAAVDVAAVALDHAASVDLASLASAELASRASAREAAVDAEVQQPAAAVSRESKKRDNIPAAVQNGSNARGSNSPSPTAAGQTTSAEALPTATRWPTSEQQPPSREDSLAAAAASRPTRGDVTTGTKLGRLQGAGSNGSSVVATMRAASTSAPQGNAQAVRSLASLGGLKVATRSAPAKPGAAPVAREPAPALAHVEKGLASLIKQSGGTATLRLNPNSLGEVRATLEVSRGVAEITLRPTTEMARGLLSESLDALRASLESKGVRVERLTVEPVERIEHAHRASPEQELEQRDADGAGDRRSRDSGSTNDGGRGGGTESGRSDERAGAGVGDAASERDGTDAEGVVLGLDTVV